MEQKYSDTSVNLERIRSDYKKWKTETSDQKIIKKIKKQVNRRINRVKKEEMSEYKFDFNKEPAYVRVLKAAIVLIPILIIMFLAFSNFIASKDFVYIYDIGEGKENFLTPNARVSEKEGENPNYRSLKSQLVYFDVPIARGSEEISIEVKLKDNLPENYMISLGAKDQELWHYNSNPLYIPKLNGLNDLQIKENVYLVNEEKPLIGLEDLALQNDVVIASEDSYNPKTNAVEGYEAKETVIGSSLRGAHTFYVYARGDLRIDVKKQDINWYNGEDIMKISLLDMNDNLIVETLIEDDGNTGVEKEDVKVQEGFLEAYGLEEKVYKLVFSDTDALIREIKINTNKIISDQIFLADNSVYNVETKPSVLFGKLIRDGEIKLTTYHSSGFQEVRYKNDESEDSFNLNVKSEPEYFSLMEGSYKFEFPSNDIIVSIPGFLAFSEDNYFEPFNQRVIDFNEDIDWLKSNADYLVTDYRSPQIEGDWIIAKTDFNINEDKLFIKDNKLSVMFNVPHLSKEDYKDEVIPIDWIKIKVHKPGLFE